MVFLKIYLGLFALLGAVITAVDANLYRYWAYRIDGTLIPYIMSPTEAAASVTFTDVVISLVVLAIMCTLGVWLYMRSVRGFAIPKVATLPLRGVITLVMLLACGFTFLGIRGGTSRAVLKG